jgi:hypothetical protein
MASGMVMAVLVVVAGEVLPLLLLLPLQPRQVALHHPV